MVKKSEAAKKEQNPLFEKRPRNFAIGLIDVLIFWWLEILCEAKKSYYLFHFQVKTSNQSEILLDLCDGRSTFVCNVRRLFWWSVWKFLHQSINSVQRWISRLVSLCVPLLPENRVFCYQDSMWWKWKRFIWYSNWNDIEYFFSVSLGFWNLDFVLKSVSRGNIFYNNFPLFF